MRTLQIFDRATTTATVPAAARASASASRPSARNARASQCVSFVDVGANAHRRLRLRSARCPTNACTGLRKREEVLWKREEGWSAAQPSHPFPFPFAGSALPDSRSSTTATSSLARTHGHEPTNPLTHCGGDSPVPLARTQWPAVHVTSRFRSVD